MTNEAAAVSGLPFCNKSQNGVGSQMNFAGYATSHLRGKVSSIPGEHEGTPPCGNPKSLIRKRWSLSNNLDGHMTSKLFQPLSRSIQASDNRVHSQGFPVVFIYSSMDGSLAGYLC